MCIKVQYFIQIINVSTNCNTRSQKNDSSKINKLKTQGNSVMPTKCSKSSTIQIQELTIIYTRKVVSSVDTPIM